MTGFRWRALEAIADDTPAAPVITEEPVVDPAPAVDDTPTEPAPYEAVSTALGHWVEDDGKLPRWNASVAPGSSSLNASVTDTHGDTQNRYTASGSYRDGTAGLTLSQSETVTTDAGSTTETDAASFSLGNGALGTGYTHTQETVTDGEKETVTRGINTAVNVDGTATIGGNYAHDGNGIGGNIVVGADGLEAGTLSGTFRAGALSGGGSATLSDDALSLSGNARYGNVGIGATYSTVFGEVAQDVVTDASDPVAAMFGGSYLTTSRRDQTTLGGSLGVGPVGVAGEVTSGSAFQLMAQLPADWENLSREERAAIEEEQQARLANIGGLADVLPLLEDGDGFRYTTNNGWNASAGASYGLVSASVGGGASSATDLTMVRTGNLLTVSMMRQDGVTSTAEMGIAGIGLDVTQGSGDAHQFQFTVDIENTEAMEQMQVFMETGLLPGAQQLDSPAQQTYAQARATVDQLGTEIAQLEAALAQYDPSDPAFAAQQQELLALYGELDGAQAELTAGRNELNDLWMAEYGVDGDRTPIDGVTIQQETDTHQETTSGAIGGVEAGRTQQTWVNQAYVGAGGDTEHRYAYDQQSYVFGSLLEHQTVQADTADDGIVLGMSSYNQLSYDGAQTIRNIRNSDVPGYVLDELVAHGFDFHLDSRIYDHFAGRTTVAMTQQQLDAMSANLNDMNNPQSAAMWSDFASRAGLYMGGGNFNLATGDAHVDSVQASHQDEQRRAWLDSIAAQDPAESPLAAGLASFAPGGTPEEAMAAASQVFATVQTPADFQALAPEQQQLFIAVIGNTAGADNDITGQRNSFEAMAAISLIEDDDLRMSQMRDLFVDDNEEATAGGNFGDAVWNFVDFTERFRGDPETYDLIQQGLSFDWSQPGVEQAAAMTPEQIAQQFRDAHTPHQHAFDGADGNRALELVQAANTQGGAAQVQQMLTATGADPQEMLRQLAHDPLRQHMMFDILVAAGYDAATLTAVPLGFDPQAP